MYITTMTMQDRLLAARVALNNAIQDTEIIERLSSLGFGEKRLQEGLEFLDKTEKLFRLQEDEYSEQYQASQDLESQWRKEKITLRMYTTLARVLFRKDPTKMSTLGLTAPQPFKLSDWILYARQFYTNAIKIEDIQKKMADYTVTADRLQEPLNGINHLEEMKIRQEKEKGDAQRATELRDQSFAQLDEYMYGLIQIARVTLYDKQQLLEKMGISVPSQ